MALQQVAHISRASQKPSEVKLDPGQRNASDYGPSVVLPDLSSPLQADERSCNYKTLLCHVGPV